MCVTGVYVLIMSVVEPLEVHVCLTDDEFSFSVKQAITKESTGLQGVLLSSASSSAKDCKNMAVLGAAGRAMTDTRSWVVYASMSLWLMMLEEAKRRVEHVYRKNEAACAVLKAMAADEGDRKLPVVVDEVPAVSRLKGFASRR
jgi:hypothetical protein